jgi:hypothetical protein
VLVLGFDVVGDSNTHATVVDNVPKWHERSLSSEAGERGKCWTESGGRQCSGELACEGQRGRD